MYLQLLYLFPLSSASVIPNGRDSFQLFVGVFDTCLVWYLLVLPSETHAVASMTSCRAVDGDTSYHSCESLSLDIGIALTGLVNFAFTI